MKSTTTWVLIADGTHGTIVRSKGPGSGLEPVTDLQGVNAADRDLGRDSPGTDPGGRAGDPPAAPDITQGRHAAEPRLTPHDKAEMRFLDDVIGEVATASTAGRFDRLVLVAPPKALGHLRDRMPDAVKSKVVGELDKDLTNVPLPQLSQHLGSVVAF